MTNCIKCGKETGPAFGMCSDCIKKEDIQLAFQEIRELAIGIKADCAMFSRIHMKADAILAITQKVSNS